MRRNYHASLKLEYATLICGMVLGIKTRNQPENCPMKKSLLFLYLKDGEENVEPIHHPLRNLQ